MQAEQGEESMLAEQGVKGEVKEGRRGGGGQRIANRWMAVVCGTGFLKSRP